MNRFAETTETYYAEPTRGNFARVFLAFLDLAEDQETVWTEVSIDETELVYIPDDEGQQYLSVYSDPIYIPVGKTAIEKPVRELILQLFDMDMGGVMINAGQPLALVLLKHDMDVFYRLAHQRKQSQS